MNDHPHTLSVPAACPMEKLSSGDAALLNAIFTANRLRPEVEGLGELMIEILPRLPAYFPETGIGLNMNIGPGRACLGMEDFIFTDVTDRFFSGHGIADLPAEIRPVLLEAVFEEVLSGIESRISETCAILEADAGKVPADPKCRHRLCFRLVRRENGFETRGHLDLDRVCLTYLAEYARKSGTRDDAKVSWDFIGTTIVFEMGWARLTAGEAATLRALDIILLDRRFSGTNDRVRARMPDGRIYDAAMDMKNGCVTLTEKGEITMTDAIEQEPAAEKNGQDDAGGHTGDRDIETASGDEAPETAGPENPAGESGDGDTSGIAPVIDTDAIPVTLVFEVGRRQMPLGALKQIGPGFIFELERDADAPVIIRAGGDAVGAGEMVRIGDRIGVRVLEVSHHAGG